MHHLSSSSYTYIAFRQFGFIKNLLNINYPSSSWPVNCSYYLLLGGVPGCTYSVSLILKLRTDTKMKGNRKKCAAFVVKISV